MSAAQLYFLLAPIVMFLVIGGGVGIWLYATRDKARHRPH